MKISNIEAVKDFIENREVKYKCKQCGYIYNIKTTCKCPKCGKYYSTSNKKQEDDNYESEDCRDA